MANVYNRGKLNFAKIWDDGVTTVGLLLLEDATGGFNPDHDFVSDVLASNTELSTTNYSRKNVVNRTETEDDANDRIQYGGDDVTWTNLGDSSKTAVSGVTFIDNGSDTANDLLTWVEFTDTGTNGSDFTLDLSVVARFS